MSYPKPVEIMPACASLVFNKEMLLNMRMVALDDLAAVFIVAE